MPEQVEKAAFVDGEPYDADDAKLLARFQPSEASRFDKLERMPAPRETSITASKTLARHFKELVHAQNHGDLPFHIDPASET